MYTTLVLDCGGFGERNQSDRLPSNRFQGCSLHDLGGVVLQAWVCLLLLWRGLVVFLLMYGLLIVLVCVMVVWSFRFLASSSWLDCVCIVASVVVCRVKEWC